MKDWFAPNITTAGRWSRAVSALILLALAWLVWAQSTLLAIIAAALGAFTLFEAVRGWCFLRACGFKTRM